ncbi:MAG: tripartite tricarboxylate transporter substrate-binding protein, partial [Tardiphaga sp.]
MRRLLLLAALVAASFFALPGGAWAQSKTIKIVVPYTPGSGPDITSRLMAEQISKAHGVNMVVENRPGAGTVIGTEAVARA